jgi:hypothetical protein
MMIVGIIHLSSERELSPFFQEYKRLNYLLKVCAVLANPLSSRYCRTMTAASKSVMSGKVADEKAGRSAQINL